MFRASTPPRSLSLSGVRLVVFGLALMLVTLPAWARQDEKKARKKPQEGAAEKGKPAAAKPEHAETAADRWEDPNAADALAKFPSVPNATVTDAEKAAIKSWSNGQGGADRGVIRRYVQGRAFELAKADNIRALSDPSAKGDKAKAMEKAASELLEPLLAPPIANNQAFRTQYVAAMIEAFKPLWKGNYHSREMAMLALSRSGDTQALKVFVDQLNDPDQVLIVKILAAVGITHVAQNGRKNLDPAMTVPAAEALSDFLRSDTEVFWVAQLRALEALGSLRLATAEPVAGKAEFAETAMGILEDAEAAPFVRVWAAWALGMMQVPGPVRNFNYPMVAHAMGDTAAEIGRLITVVPDKQLPKVVRLTDLLIQMNRAFEGEPEVRDSGLLHSNNPSYGAAQPFVVEVDRRVKELTKAAAALTQAMGNQVAKQREELKAKVNDLKTFLDKNRPAAKPLFAGDQ